MLTQFFILALAISCVAWTVTQEEVFREVREFCKDKSKCHPKWYCRKFFYLPTCHYCFSHYVTIFFLVVTRFKLYDSWLVTFFALVFLANVYMTIYGILRQVLKVNRLRGNELEHQDKMARELLIK